MRPTSDAENLRAEHSILRLRERDLRKEKEQ